MSDIRDELVELIAKDTPFVCLVMDGDEYRAYVHRMSPERARLLCKAASIRLGREDVAQQAAKQAKEPSK